MTTTNKQKTPQHRFEWAYIYIYKYYIYIYNLKHVYIMCVFVCVYWMHLWVILTSKGGYHTSPGPKFSGYNFAVPPVEKKNIHTKITQRQKVDFSGLTFALAPILQPLTTKKKKAVLHPKTKWIPPIRRVPLHPNGGGCPCWKCHPRRLSQMED